jgi:outer membrane protein assembly factor BamB
MQKLSLLGLLASLLFIQPPERAVAELDGGFDQAPVSHWQRRLPGPQVVAFSHTERGRAATDGRDLFMGSAGSSVLYQLSRESGEVLNTYAAGAAVQAEPVLGRDHVVFSDTGGYTWRYALGSEQEMWSHFGGAAVAERPTVHEGTVYVTNVDDVVYALDGQTGELKWRYARPEDPTRDSELRLFGAPSPIVVGSTVLAGFSDGSLVALDRFDGELQWERRVGEGRYPDLVATPLVHDGDVFVGGYSEPFVSLDLTTRNVRWRLDVGTAAAPVLVDQTLFHGGTDGVLRALDRLTGDVIWTWDSETTGALTQPQVVDAGVLVGSSDGSLYLVDAADGAPLWSYEPGHLVDGVTVAPLVAGRQLVLVTNAGNLVSLVSPRVPRARDQGRLGTNPPL